MNQTPECMQLLEVIVNGRTINLGVEKIRYEGKNYFSYMQYHSNGKQRCVAKNTTIRPERMKELIEEYQRRK